MPRPALSLAVLLCAAMPARAQYSQSLFLEAARDPGRADVARTSRELAMGTVQAISGTADEAVVSPGSLMVGSGTDAVVSFGRFGYARQELAKTPRQLPPFDATRRLSATSNSPVGFGAVAVRRSRWAAAGFLDATSRYSHALQTDKALLYSAGLFPTRIEESAPGSATVEQSAVRFGGSIAVGNKRFGVGTSVYLVHFTYSIDAVTPIEIGSSSIGDPVFTIRCCVEDSDRVAFDAWSPGLGFSGDVSPSEHLRVTARWRREPTFAATRRGSRADARSAQPVEFKVPDVYGVGLIAPIGLTTIVGELARHQYGSVYSPLGKMSSDPNYQCAQMREVHHDICTGWNFPYHETLNTTVVKAGVEQGIPAGAGRILVRAGIAREPGYTLARDANHPSTRRDIEFPSPAVVTSFEPPREDLTWLSAGAAFTWKGAEIGFGFARAEHQVRILVDLRIVR